MIQTLLWVLVARQWDFGANPRDPQYGALTDRFVFRIQTTDDPKRDTPVRH
jgi:hypothetical protein